MLKILSVISLLLLVVAVKGYAQQTNNKLLTNNLQQEKLLREKILHSRADTNRIRLFIQLGSNFIGRSPTKDSYSDSAFKYYNVASALIHKANVTNLQTEMLSKFAHYYYVVVDKKTALQFESKVLSIYRQNNDLFNQAQALQLMGDYAADLKPAHLYYEKARLLFQQTGHKAEAIGALKQWSQFLVGEGKYDSAKVVLADALIQYQKIGEKKISSVYDEFAGISDVKGFVNEELYYYLEAVKCMEAYGGTDNAARYYNRLGIAYFKSRKYERSLFYTKKAISYGQRLTLYPAISWSINSLLALNRPAEALALLQNEVKHDPPGTMTENTIANASFGGVYTALKKYNEAEKYYLTSIEIYKIPIELGSRNSLIESQNRVRLYTALVKFYIITKQYQKAHKYLQQIPESEDKKISPKFLSTVHQLRFKVDSALGNYQSAIRSYQKYTQINDSINSVKNAKAVEEIDAKYQTAKKEQSIRALENDKKIETIRVQKAVLQRNITFVAIIAAIVLSGFFYNSYRRKKMSELLISQKNNQLQTLLADKDASNYLINKKNDQLQLLLIEKDWLLKEVHHRVKNNLHTVFCLLESQAKYLADDALKAIEVSQHRIFAMSLIHQKLYQSDDIKTVDMNVYLLEFIGYLSESFDTGSYIRFETAIAPITLDIAQAIPVALIINEAVTNAIKYAFPSGRTGVISISFQETEDEIRLNVTDNGVGIGSMVDMEQLNSLGLVLMQGLTEDLHGTFTIKNEDGTNVQVVFPLVAALVV